MTAFWQFITAMDRRWVFLGVAIVVIVPFFVPMGLEVGITKETQTVYDTVDELAGTGKPLLLAMDYDPGTMAELQPMANAVLDHCFARDIPVIGLTFQPTGVGLAEEALESAVKRFHETYPNRPEKVQGKDWVFLGYKPYYSIVIVQMGQDFGEAHETDHRGVLKKDLPIIANVKNYDDIGLCMDLAGSALPRAWINYAVGRFGAKFTMGVTGVMAADFYTYVQTKQSHGIIGGMKGAAEYERLNLEDYQRRRNLDRRKLIMREFARLNRTPFDRLDAEDRARYDRLIGGSKEKLRTAYYDRLHAAYTKRLEEGKLDDLSEEDKAKHLERMKREYDRLSRSDPDWLGEQDRKRFEELFEAYFDQLDEAQKKEYRELVAGDLEKLYGGKPVKLGLASRGMDSQSWTHLFIILLIVLGNLAYFGLRGQQQG